MGNHRQNDNPNTRSVADIRRDVFGEIAVDVKRGQTARRLVTLGAATAVAGALASGAATGEMPAASAKASGAPAPAPAPVAAPQRAVAAAPASSSTYTVKAGDTLSKIGTAIGVPWQKLAAANGISAPWTIYAGQVLKTSGAGAAPAPAPAAPRSPAAPAAPIASVTNSGAAATAVRAAMGKTGHSYVYGGESDAEGGYDCSGLTQYAYKTVGISLPRTAAAQAGAGRAVTRAQLQPGDLIFYYSPISHVAMYIGNGQVVQAANPKTGVQVASVDWAGSPVAFRRVA